MHTGNTVQNLALLAKILRQLQAATDTQSAVDLLPELTADLYPICCAALVHTDRTKTVITQGAEHLLPLFKTNMAHGGETPCGLVCVWEQQGKALYAHSFAVNCEVCLLLADNEEKWPQEKILFFSALAAGLQSLHGRVRASQKAEEWAALSHELKNPLQIILTSEKCLALQLQRSWAGELPEDIQDALRCQERNVYRLQRILDNMLDMQRVESGMLICRKEWFDVSETINGLLPELRRTADCCGINLESDMLLQMYAVGDALQLRRILLNLFTNAVKACNAASQNPQRITLTAAESENGIQITVQDTGCGMTESQREHLGEKFYRADNDYAAEQGSGLGVYLCRKILRDMGGTLAYTTAEGQGTAATVMLPSAHSAALQQSGVLHAAGRVYDDGNIEAQLRQELAELEMRQ